MILIHYDHPDHRESEHRSNSVQLMREEERNQLMMILNPRVMFSADGSFDSLLTCIPVIMMLMLHTQRRGGG